MSWLLVLLEIPLAGVIVVALVLRRAEFLRLTSTFGAPLWSAPITWANAGGKPRSQIWAMLGWSLCGVLICADLISAWRTPLNIPPTLVHLAFHLLLAFAVGALTRGPEPCALFPGGIYWRRLYRWSQLDGYQWLPSGQRKEQLRLLFNPAAAAQANIGTSAATTHTDIPCQHLRDERRQSLDVLLGRYLTRRG